MKSDTEQKHGGECIITLGEHVDGLEACGTAAHEQRGGEWTLGREVGLSMQEFVL